MRIRLDRYWSFDDLSEAVTWSPPSEREVRRAWHWVYLNSESGEEDVDSVPVQFEAQDGLVCVSLFGGRAMFFNLFLVKYPQAELGEDISREDPDVWYNAEIREV